jgi:hypothetical protein
LEDGIVKETAATIPAMPSRPEGTENEYPSYAPCYLIMDGDIGEFTGALMAEHQAEQLAAMAEESI